MRGQIGNFQPTGHTGGRIPFDTPEESTILHDSLMAGYRICSWFQPFVSVTGSTALAEGKVGR